MENKGKKLYHSTVRLEGSKIVYIDPWQISGEPHDADLILVTHDHHDHYSPADIEKLSRADTLLVVPASMAVPGAQTVRPGMTYSFCELPVETIAAYNIGRPFHTKEKEYVGYIVTLDGVRYYIAGDTDKIPENSTVQCDVAFVPVGGMFTMDAPEAAALVNAIRPKIAVPTHYGTVTDSADAAERFAKAVNAGITVEIHL